MSDKPASGRTRGPIWRHRRHFFDSKDRSRSEVTLNQVTSRSTSISSSHNCTQYFSAHNIHLDSTLAGPTKKTHGSRHGFFRGKKSPTISLTSLTRKKGNNTGNGVSKSSGTRIGYALALTGAKMGLMPCLSSESLIRLGDPTRYRSMGTQTDSPVKHLSPSPSPSPNMTPTRRSLSVQPICTATDGISSCSSTCTDVSCSNLDTSSPLYACLAPLVSAAQLDQELRRQRVKEASVMAVCASNNVTEQRLASTVSFPGRPSISVILSDDPPSYSPPSSRASLSVTPTSSFNMTEADSTADPSDSYGPLLHPLKALTITRRKSSTGDSAVDLKFTGDEERSTNSGDPPSPLPPSTPDAVQERFRDTEEPHSCRQVGNARPVPMSTASWRKLRNVVVYAPFFQQYQRHKYPWIQLAGHQGNFRSGEQGTILKKHCLRECLCLKALMTDILRPYVPEYKGEVMSDNERYVCMQDLLMDFESPSLMDCKLGLRTYLEEELTKAKDNPTPRTDMYEKMMSVDSNEPTEEEHRIQGVTKPRYMQWRETISSTATLGFRIEGIKRPVEDGDENGIPREKTVSRSTNDFKRTRTRDDVMACLKDFTDNNPTVVEKYCQRLRSIAATLECSAFFQSHELIGSSLLFVHDRRGKVNVWMIDFGKTMPLPDGVSIDHRSPWVEGNHEDGYMFGLTNVISIFEQMLAESTNCAQETRTSCLGNETTPTSLTSSTLSTVAVSER